MCEKKQQTNFRNIKIKCALECEGENTVNLFLLFVVTFFHFSFLNFGPFRDLKKQFSDFRANLSSRNANSSNILIKKVVCTN